MRIDVLQLLREPIGTQASIEFDLGFQRLSDDLSVNAVGGRLDLLHTDEGVLVQGILSVAVDLECGRCLIPVSQTITIEVDEQFVSSSPSASDGDQVYLIDPDHHLDMRPILRDQVIVSTPMHVLCVDDCLGLCPSCGKNLNEGPCDCQLDDIDPRLAVLRTLMD
jgi:uncharacterized protein